MKAPGWLLFSGIPNQAKIVKERCEGVVATSKMTAEPPRQSINDSSIIIFRMINQQGTDYKQPY
jgi:hypothetical protein